MVEADKVRGDGPPYIVETQLPDVKKKDGRIAGGQKRKTTKAS